MPDLNRPVFPRKGKFLGPHRLNGGCLDQFGIHLVVMDSTEFEDATGAGPVPRPDKNKLLRECDSETGLGKKP